MGIGDKMMAIGDAWALHQADPQKRRVAIGDGKIVDQTDNALVWGLPFIARASHVAEREPVQWVISHPGTRPYIDYRAMRRELINSGRRTYKHRKLASMLGRYIWNNDYHATPAPIRLTPDEEEITKRWAKEPFVAIEPHIKATAPVAKQWPVERYQEVVRQLRAEGIKVVQISASGQGILPGAVAAPTGTYREALAVLKAASLYIGPEGGLHHGSAAMGTKAVVLFGGYISPKVTGYDFHVNLTGDAHTACGTKDSVCPHCVAAMDNITPELVMEHAMAQLKKEPT